MAGKNPARFEHSSNPSRLGDTGDRDGAGVNDQGGGRQPDYFLDEVPQLGLPRAVGKIKKPGAFCAWLTLHG